MDGQTTALPRRVLGIDPGLAVSGYCLVDERGSGGHLVHCGALRSTAKQPRAERLYRIYGLVMALVALVIASSAHASNDLDPIECSACESWNRSIGAAPPDSASGR